MNHFISNIPFLIVLVGICLGGIWHGGYCPAGICPGGICPGGICPDTHTTTIRTLPSTSALQSHGVRRTKRHMYLLCSVTTRREALVRFQRTPDGLDT